MFEELLVYVLLWDIGVASDSEYGKYLDDLFMEIPENDLLLELEWHFSDTQKTISIIQNHCSEQCLNYDMIGRLLFSKLEKIYSQNILDIQTFGAKSYAIWERLPESIHQIEPFWTLSYADDPLSWGDEKQTRELYEKAFCFYKST